MGEEPYSVAILMDELLTHPYLGDTGLNGEAIAKARGGVYRS